MTPLRLPAGRCCGSPLSPPPAPRFAGADRGADTRSTVSLVKGDSRRKNITDALTAIDDQIRPVLRTKKYVAIKVNNVSVTNQLAASHADAIHGILDYLQAALQGPGAGWSNRRPATRWSGSRTSNTPAWRRSARSS